ncbi:MAG: hypothetical protein OEV40_04300 [Acidimicrobiia bacterium]|nr:hypothetical protein [Acidimicrobiia bacterium]
MLIALIVVAVLAVGLVIMLLLTRSSAAEFRALAERRESALLAERDSLKETRTQLGRELSAARNEVEQRTRELARQTAEVRRLDGEIVKARTVAGEQTARIESQSSEISALVADNNALQQRAEAAEAAQKEAEEATAAAEARNARVVIGDVATVDGAHPETLWNLEVTRSERTWRNSVAVDPSAPTGPFEATDDPVRLAVEIEAAALRENVGAFITIDWQAAPVDDPARRHLIVRVAQEMLEAAARNPEPLRLVATGDDDVRLELQPIEADDTVVTVPAPRFATDLVDVRTETGLSVTVKAD